MQATNDRKQTNPLFLSAVIAIVTAGLVSGAVLQAALGNKPDMTRLDALEAKVAQQSAELSTVTTDVLKLSNAEEDNLVILDATRSEFQSLQTGVGLLFVSVEDAEAYADGYRITLHLGNPNAATLYSGKGSIGWYHGQADGTKSAEVKDFEIIKDVPAGFWTPLEVVISPATNTDLNALFVRMDFNNVKLSMAR